MTALATPPEETAPTTLAAVPAPTSVVSADPVPPEVAAAEAHWWRGLLLGIAIGIPVCALVWMGMVWLALGVVADSDWPIWPAVGMAAVVGVFAGAFLGGWAGVTACAEHLDETELHASRPRA
jgi:hypothetical protein